MISNCSIKRDAWAGCYADSWQDLIVPEAFAHPAKVARGLSHRIYRHLIEQGYVRPGMVVLDPFAGIGGFALDAMTYGLRYVGVELEPRFVALGQQNLALWRQRYGFTGGIIVQGDSRRLREVLAGAQVQVVAGSPPYAWSDMGGRGGEGPGAAGAPHGGSHQASGKASGIGYGTTPGQLGAMPPGQGQCVVGSPPWHNSQAGASVAGPSSGMWKSYEKGFRPTETGTIYASSQEHYGTTTGQLGAMPPGALVSSPPYAGAGEVLGTHNGIDWSKAQEGGKVATPARQASGEGYGTSAGQLGAMPPGVVVGSPPWEVVLSATSGIDREQRQRVALAMGRPQSQVSPVDVPSPSQATYGTAPAQLGNTSGDTFWSAAAQIMQELALLLPAGAVCAWVVKAYIKNKKIVPFDKQWQSLCEAHGFHTVEIIHASLIEHHGVQETFFGESENIQTARKSFFRRLCEKKGSPSIDHEVVLVTIKE